MHGITSVGTFVPRYRLANDLIGDSWRAEARPGSRSIANFDEDAFTMAVAAAERCLAVGPEEVDAVYYASTSAPYREKAVAPMLATVCDLRPGVATGDFGGSLRGATTALGLALDAVELGRRRDVLVAAADLRVPRPGAELELALGDAAGAVTVGADPIAAVDSFWTRSDDFLHLWRRDGDAYVDHADTRFARQHGYLRNVVEGVAAALREAGAEAADFAKVVLDAPDPSSARAAAKGLGLSAEQLVDLHHGELGHTGTAGVLLGLQGALEAAAPGDRIAIVSYGDGLDVVLLTATEKIADWAPARTLSSQLGDRRELDSFTRYCEFRGIVGAGEKTEGVFSSTALLHRTQKQDVRLYGGRCANCGQIHYPIVRVCGACHSEGPFEELKLARSGDVFTLSKERYFPTPDPPLVVSVVDLEGGGRIVLQTTDCDATSFDIGTPVELVYRRYHEGQGFHNYYWKCRPVEV